MEMEENKMTVQGIYTDIFIWSECSFEYFIQNSGLKGITIEPEGSSINIFFMTPRKLDELIEKLQELKGK